MLCWLSWSLWLGDWLELELILEVPIRRSWFMVDEDEVEPDWELELESGLTTLLIREA